MNRFLLPVLTASAFFLTPILARAQAPAPYNRPQTNPFARPVFSPYLNLLRGGTNPAINYYGLVRPEIDFRNSILGLQQQVDAQAAATATAEGAGALGTGHPTQFNNLSHYFNYQGGPGPRRPGAGPAVTAPTYGTGGRQQGATGPQPARTR
jgi:hypothetical protein